MRWLLLFLLAGIVGVIGVAGYFIFEYNEPQVAQANRLKMAERSISNFLISAYDISDLQLVVGREFAPAHFDFRGSVDGGDRQLPVYGVVVLTCESLQTEAKDCWRLDVLERDGRAWSPPLQRPVPPVADAESAQAQAAPPSDAPPETSVAQAPPVLQYIVTAEAVNGREGPGTEFPVKTTVTPEMPLELELRDGNWGRFRLNEAADSGDSDGTESFWILMRLVRPKASSQG